MYLHKTKNFTCTYISKVGSHCYITTSIAPSFSSTTQVGLRRLKNVISSTITPACSELFAWFRFTFSVSHLTCEQKNKQGKTSIFASVRKSSSRAIALKRLWDLRCPRTSLTTGQISLSSLSNEKQLKLSLT